MAKEGEGYGVGDYVLISGISKDDETSLSYPSYVKGQEYTLDMLLSDFQNKNSYKTYTKTKIGDQEYVLLDEDSNRYYYTVTNNYPVLIQVIGESMQDNEAVTKITGIESSIITKTLLFYDCCNHTRLDPMALWCAPFDGSTPLFKRFRFFSAQI